jgi:hypothetical protein
LRSLSASDQRVLNGQEWFGLRPAARKRDRAPRLMP